MTPLEQHKMTSFTKMQNVVTNNVTKSTLKQQLHENKHLTAIYLSQLSYFKFDTIRSKMNEFGAMKLSLYDHHGTQGFFAELDDMAVVSFRGTQLDKSVDLKNALTFWKHPFCELKVHKGFIKSLDSLIPNIVNDVKSVDSKKRIVYVGHSMGGALATLLSIAHKPDELCTFGAPRVAGKELAKHLENVDCHRIVNKWDWVNSLPPNIPLLLSYKHATSRHSIDSGWRWKDILHPHRLVTYLDALLEEEKRKN